MLECVSIDRINETHQELSKDLSCHRVLMGRCGYHKYFNARKITIQTS